MGCTCVWVYGMCTWVGGLGCEWAVHVCGCMVCAHEWVGWGVSGLYMCVGVWYVHMGGWAGV